MSIDSINPKNSRIQPRRVGEKRAVGGDASRGSVGESETSTSKSDRVEISSAARNLASGSGSVTRTKGALSPDRIARVTQRINEGYYDREGIREEIARRVLTDLQ